MPKRPNTPYKTKTQRVGWTRVLSPSSGGHSKMSPTSTLRGLGLGETPLRRWEAVTEMGRSQALICSIATPSQRRTIDRGTTPRLTSVGYTDRCREVLVSSELCTHVNARLLPRRWFLQLHWVPGRAHTDAQCINICTKTNSTQIHGDGNDGNVSGFDDGREPPPECPPALP